MNSTPLTTEATLQFAPQGDCLVAKIQVAQLRDSLIVNQMRQEFLAYTGERPAKAVILDLSQLTFVGSIAFLAFLAMRRAPGVERVVLTGIDPKVKSVFEVCKLIPTAQRPDAPFEVAATSEEAVNQILAA